MDFGTDGSAAVEIYSEARMTGGAVPGAGPAAAGAKSKTTAGILAIFLGGIGVHKFYLGYTGVGVLHIVAWVFVFFIACGLGCVAGLVTFGIGSLVVPVLVWFLFWLLPITEGIIYLMKSDEQFHEQYVLNRRIFF